MKIAAELVVMNALNQREFFCRFTSDQSQHTDVVGVSLSEPHIDHDNGPRTRNNGMYLSMYVSFTPRL